MQVYTIQEQEAAQRFDKYLKKLLKRAPGSFIYKMLRKKNITLNGKKADGTEKLKAGDEVKLFLSEETFDKFSAKEESLAGFQALKQLPKPPHQGSSKPLSASGKLQVVYEDEDILIINKPAGMLSQKVSPSDVSANEYVLSYLIEKGELTKEMIGTFKPSVCNRLDRNTSGLLTAGKTLKGLQEMSRALKERTVQKFYRCIVKGEVKKNSYLKGWLLKDGQTNKVTVYPTKAMAEEVSARTKHTSESEKIVEIETEYKPVAVKNGYSLLEVHLITGKSHQIRAHLASIGHPIVGDMKYGSRRVNELFRKKVSVSSQLLHAYRMEFEDERTVIAPCGEEFDRAWKFIEDL